MNDNSLVDAVIDAEDRAAIEADRRDGGDPRKVREITFYIYCPTQSAARAFVKASRHFGYAGSIGAPFAQKEFSKDPWPVYIVLHDRLTIDVISKHSKVLSALALRYDADFDGWEASM